MLRTIRLTASVLVLTSGMWLGSVFLLARVDSHPQAVPSVVPVGHPAGSGLGSPVIREPGHADRGSPQGGPLTTHTAASDGLAEVAQILTRVEAPLEPFQPLPPPPAAAHQSPPSLPGVYRSALDLPPPPLLDAHAPPPLVGGSTWRKPTSREASLVAWRGHADETVRHSILAHRDTPADSSLEDDYVVRDGDDLTAIAVRVYGHPAAATLLWRANRDRLATPDLLPIGMLLRLPTPSQFQGLPERPGGWIEPASSTR